MDIKNSTAITNIESPVYQHDLQNLCQSLDNINKYTVSKAKIRVLGARAYAYCETCGHEDDYILIIEDMTWQPGRMCIHYLCSVCLDKAIEGA